MGGFNQAATSLAPVLLSWSITSIKRGRLPKSSENVSLLREQLQTSEVFGLELSRGYVLEVASRARES